MRRAGFGTMKRTSNSVSQWSCDSLTLHTIWIIPEVSLTQKLDMVCGSVEMKWSCLPNTISDIHISRELDVPAGTLKVILEYSQVFRTLEHCNARYCRSDCQYPRDKVYGLLGLTPEKGRIQVDYEKTIVESLLGHCRDLARRAAGLLRSDMLLSPYII
jgi:hypothetical protein